MNIGKSNDRRKKIGIITFHRAINYGALLQTYALQKVIKRMGHDCIIIDYRNVLLEERHQKKRLRDSRNWKDVARFIFYARHYNIKHDKFRNFSDKYMTMSSLCHNYDDLYQLANEYDGFICGSDQVWNCEITDFDKVYFLEFVNETAKKHSYAASFGFDQIPEEYIEEYRNLLADFGNITVREEQGKKIINALVNRDVEVVLDPTMLLNSTEWEEIAVDYKKETDYILVYAFGSSPTMIEFAHSLAKKTGCKIVYISYSIMRRVKAVYEKCVGPEEFIGLFKNASYIVTNSFHGTAFSINFNKAFFVELLPPPAKVNSRLENILDNFGLRNRQIINGSNDDVFAEIDYSAVNNKLKLERMSSLNYLKRILEE